MFKTTCANNECFRCMEPFSGLFASGSSLGGEGGGGEGDVNSPFFKILFNVLMA